MNESRKSYEEALLKLMDWASIRELRCILIFARAYLGKAD